jgi:hypothetical protein
MCRHIRVRCTGNVTLNATGRRRLADVRRVLGPECELDGSPSRVRAAAPEPRKSGADSHTESNRAAIGLSDVRVTVGVSGRTLPRGPHPPPHPRRRGGVSTAACTRPALAGVHSRACAETETPPDPHRLRNRLAPREGEPPPCSYESRLRSAARYETETRTALARMPGAARRLNYAPVRDARSPGGSPRPPLPPRLVVTAGGGRPPSRRTPRRGRPCSRWRMTSPPATCGPAAHQRARKGRALRHRRRDGTRPPTSGGRVAVTAKLTRRGRQDHRPHAGYQRTARHEFGTQVSASAAALRLMTIHGDAGERTCVVARDMVLVRPPT